VAGLSIKPESEEQGAPDPAHIRRTAIKGCRFFPRGGSPDSECLCGLLWPSWIAPIAAEIANTTFYFPVGFPFLLACYVPVTRGFPVTTIVVTTIERKRRITARNLPPGVYL
jgi:hypothetical protein